MWSFHKLKIQSLFSRKDEVIRFTGDKIRLREYETKSTPTMLHPKNKRRKVTSHSIILW